MELLNDLVDFEEKNSVESLFFSKFIVLLVLCPDVGLDVCLMNGHSIIFGLLE